LNFLIGLHRLPVNCHTDTGMPENNLFYHGSGKFTRHQAERSQIVQNKRKKCISAPDVLFLCCSCPDQGIERVKL
jgi:hypothetical protein